MGQDGQEPCLANARHHHRQPYAGVYRLVLGLRACRALAGDRLRPLELAAFLACCPAGTCRRHIQDHPHLPSAALRYPSRGRRIDAVAARSGDWLVLRGSGSNHALLGSGGARVVGWARRRQFLVVHAIHQPLLPQAPARHGARDSGRRRQFWREHRPIRHALDHWNRVGWLALWACAGLHERRRRELQYGCRTPRRSMCRSSLCSALPPG